MARGLGKKKSTCFALHRVFGVLALPSKLGAWHGSTSINMANGTPCKSQGGLRGSHFPLDFSTARSGRSVGWERVCSWFIFARWLSFFPPSSYLVVVVAWSSCCSSVTFSRSAWLAPSFSITIFAFVPLLKWHRHGQGTLNWGARRRGYRKTAEPFTQPSSHIQDGKGW